MLQSVPDFFKVLLFQRIVHQINKIKGISASHIVKNESGEEVAIKYGSGMDQEVNNTLYIQCIYLIIHSKLGSTHLTVYTIHHELESSCAVSYVHAILTTINR